MTAKLPWKTTVLIGLFMVVALVLFSYPPMEQSLIYHAFADTRNFCGTPNFMDVFSNGSFALFGFSGLFYVLKTKKSLQHFKNNTELLIWTTFFAGAILIAMGSAYYHFTPNNQTLVWDRLPMTLSFMSLFSIVIIERLSLKPRTGGLIFMTLLALGLTSVLYWFHTESLGHGDLRLYILVQFFPILAIPYLCLFFPARYPGTKYITFTLLSYGSAKICEHFDHQLFEFFHGVISGHTLKHLAASLSILWMILYLRAQENS